MPACCLCLRAAGLPLGLLLSTPLSGAGLAEEELWDTSSSINPTFPSEGGQVSTLAPAAAMDEGVLEKQGSCTSVDFPKLGICEDQFQVDSQCPGNMKCCRNGRGEMTCATPKF
ncbi:WAP four-disulfide core domain protein 2 [Microtus ochrogaster]|uniref:WAP four-disulfide core domain protein 2 n=1 Tax=Microtus ochrogaster TaxID=79684 RepID=A0A8J6KNA3_MICOH|nr:WAP four-disulfide core domain protein 2 [Microtus ochrogaster]